MPALRYTGKTTPVMIEILQRHIVARLGNDIENLDLVLSKFRPLEVKSNRRFTGICRIRG
jgi:hypothetical protein